MINLKDLDYFASNNDQDKINEYLRTCFSKIDPLTKKLNDATKWMVVVLVLYFFFIEGILKEITFLGVNVEDWEIFRPFFLPAFCSISFYYMVVSINREEIRYIVKILFNTRFNVFVDNKNWLAGNNIIELHRFYFPFSFRYEIDKLKGSKLFGWTDLLYGIPFLIFQWIILSFLINEINYAFKNIYTYWFSKYLFVLSCFLLLAWLWVFIIMIVKGVKSQLAIDGFDEHHIVPNKSNMGNFSEKIAWSLIGVGVLVIIIFTLWGNFINVNSNLQPNILANYGTLIGGTAGILFTLAGYFLIFSTLKTNKKQQFETTFHNRLTMFQEFRTKQIALKETKGEAENKKEVIHYGSMFFDYLFTKQMDLKEGRKETLEYYNYHLKFHRAQFEYYFGFFEMCLSAMFESNLNQQEIARHADFLHNLLSEQEKFIFSLMNQIVPSNQFPLCSNFSRRFEDIFKATISSTQ